jgi:hypothetical protein
MKVPKSAINKLGKIVASLEVWQNKYDVDPENLAGAAKDRLLRLLRKLENSQEES